MDTHSLPSVYMPAYGTQPYWDLYVSASLVLLAYHCCEPGRRPIPAIYDRAVKQYVCPECSATHPTRIGEGDHLLSPVSDRGYYIGYVE